MMNQAQPPSGPVRNLPIWSTVTATYGSVFSDHIQDLPRAIAFPMGLSVLLGLLQYWVSPELMIPDPEAPPESVSGAAILIGVLAIIPYTLFSVAWQRTVLLNEPPPWIMPWTTRHWRYLIYSILLTVIAIGLSIALFLPSLLFFSSEGQEGIVFLYALIVFLILLAVGLRLSFVFPAIAVDERYGLRDAWRHSKRQGFRLLAAAILFYIPLLIAIVIVVTMISLLGAPILILSAGGTGEPPSLIVMLLWLVASSGVTYVSMALAFSFIAIAFRTCSGWVPGPPAASAPAMPRSHDDQGEA